MLNGLVVNGYGTERWYKDDQLHREDGPALEFVNGNKEWYLNGHLHRESGPAVEWASGLTEWYYKGVFAGRGDKPDPALWERVTSGPLNGCIVDCNGYKYWYKDDQLHREDGPAIEYKGGTKQWYLYGMNLGWGAEGFWKMWEWLTDEQRSNPNLLKHLPR